MHGLFGGLGETSSATPFSRLGGCGFDARRREYAGKEMKARVNQRGLEVAIEAIQEVQVSLDEM
jgi:hypothetical protein